MSSPARAIREEFIGKWLVAGSGSPEGGRGRNTRPTGVGCAWIARRNLTALADHAATIVTVSGREGMSMSRCKTGWRIRKDKVTGKWEAYCNLNGPHYREFRTWRRAFAYVRMQTRALSDETIDYMPVELVYIEAWDTYVLADNPILGAGVVDET